MFKSFIVVGKVTEDIHQVCQNSSLIRKHISGIFIVKDEVIRHPQEHVTPV